MWTINISRQAAKKAKKLDKPIREQIKKKLREISMLSDPRMQGKALAGNFAGLWRYRVGDYRIICSIEKSELLVLVIDTDHRSAVYNNAGKSARVMYHSREMF